MEFHPIANIFPLLVDDEIQRLADDIREHGQRHPVWLYEGKILDGRNRWTACQLADKEPITRDFTGNRIDALAFVWSENFHRRHLNSGQAAIAEVERGKLCESYADELEKIRNDQPKGGRPKGGEKPSQLIDEVSPNDRKTDAHRAKLAGTNRQYIRDAERILDENPEAAEAIKRGEKTIPQVKRELKRKAVGELGQTNTADRRVGKTTWNFLVGDCLSLPFDDDHFDLVFCSPPYEAQRRYAEAEFKLTGEDWVDWALRCFHECLRVSSGLVAWVVEGRTSAFSYSATPFRLLARLHEDGVKVRKPCVYQRNGIPGTGGPDFLRNDWEPIICATKHGKLPWADNTAMGLPPVITGDRVATNRKSDGSRKSVTYRDPEVCNPGNIIAGKVGAGQLGWRDAHENEAPFPEWLAEFFIKSFCPPGGIVLDPFSGSGTTVSVALNNGRSGTGVDIRSSQVWLGETRLMGLSVSDRNSGEKPISSEVLP